MLTEEQLDTFRDFTKFAPAFIIIRKKSGGTSYFHLNRAQRYLHKRLEEQRKATGKVRAIVLKGRQQGCSTYIQARFFHQVVTTRGKKAFILTHEKEATENLFGMARKFYEDIEPGLIPVADTANAKKLYFREFDSGYAVGTAGNKAVGRSQTIQLFHGSEVGYWQFAEEHAKGVLDAIASEPGTEVILESTANGIGNYYHQRWISASEENNEYQAIFLPWYWQDEYTDRTPGFKLNDEEEHYFEMYKDNGLTKEHLSWRRIKMSSYSNDEEAARESFQSQYPFNATEAFKNPISQTFINSKYVDRARKNEVEKNGKLIIGVDVAISDRDRTAIIRRKARCAYKLEYISNYNTMEIVGRVKRVIGEENPAKVYIDCIGIGAGVVDRLQEMGFSCVEGVNVGRSANDKEKFKNLRAELWSDMRDWLYAEIGCQIPNDDKLHSELCSLGMKELSNGQIKIEGKDELRSRGLPSPDGADALALTFFGGNTQDMSANFDVGTLSQREKGMFF